MKDFQILFCSGSAEFPGTELSPWQLAALKRAGARADELDPRNFPYREQMRPWSFRPLPISSTMNGLRMVMPLSGDDRRHVHARIAEARHTLIITASQGLDLLDRSHLPIDLAERCTIVAVAPVARALFTGRRPVPGARLRLVVPRDEAVVTIPLAKRAGIHHVDYIPPGHLHAIGRREAHRVIRAEIQRARQRAMQSPPPRSQPLRIDLAAPPFPGHLHPILAIAHRLRERGVHVRILTTAQAVPIAEAEGFETVTLLKGREREIERLTSTPNERVPGKSRTLAHLNSFRGNMRLQRALADQLAALWKQEAPDAFVADFVLPIAGHTAERRRIPWITTCPSPLAIETRQGPPSYVRGLSPRSGPVGRMRDRAGWFLVGVVKQLAVVSAWRWIAWLYVYSPYRLNGSELAYSSRRILAIGDRTLEFSDRWPRAVRFTGPILETPRSVRERLDAVPADSLSGRPLVVLTLGTHNEDVKAELAPLIAEIASAVPEAELLVGLGGTRLGDEAMRTLSGIAEHVRVVPYLDYDRLGGAALVVHHGGMGITWSAIAAGVRQIVHPVDHDQFDVAARLEHVGLAVRVDDPSDLPAVIAAELARSVGPDEAQLRTESALRLVQHGDGAERAAEQIMRDLRRWRPDAFTGMSRGATGSDLSA